MSIEIWTSPTPNGWKVTVMLEELIEAGAPLQETLVRTINLSRGEQFSEEFTARNPNQKIPLLICPHGNIMESGAILQYLAEHYGPHLLPEQNRWQILQWLYWQAANVGPAFGNKLSYTRYNDQLSISEKAHPLERFGTEAKRLAIVLNHQLEGKDFVCGDSFSIADIAIYPWLRAYKWSKVDITDQPNVMSWMLRVRARPGVGRGLAYGVPKDEVDGWSAERKAQYKQNGSKIASNENMKAQIKPG